MILSTFVAIGKNREIGLDNKLLWRISSDLKRFKKLTSGHHMIMGRKTYESIGKPLPNRVSVVISRQKDLDLPGSIVVSSLEEAVEFCKLAGEDEAFIIGGASIYTLGISISDKLYLSVVDYDGAADTFFPEFEMNDYEYLNTERFEKSEKDEYGYNYYELKKK